MENKKRIEYTKELLNFGGVDCSKLTGLEPILSNEPVMWSYPMERDCAEEFYSVLYANKEKFGHRVWARYNEHRKILILWGRKKSSKGIIDMLWDSFVTGALSRNESTVIAKQALKALSIVTPENLELLAAWFDKEQKNDQRNWSESTEVQDKLRKMASLSRNVMKKSKDAISLTIDRG